MQRFDLLTFLWQQLSGYSRVLGLLLRRQELKNKKQERRILEWGSMY